MNSVTTCRERGPLPSWAGQVGAPGGTPSFDSSCNFRPRPEPLSPDSSGQSEVSGRWLPEAVARGRVSPFRDGRYDGRYAVFLPFDLPPAGARNGKPRFRKVIHGRRCAAGLWSWASPPALPPRVRACVTAGPPDIVRKSTPAHPNSSGGQELNPRTIGEHFPLH